MALEEEYMNYVSELSDKLTQEQDKLNTPDFKKIKEENPFDKQIKNLRKLIPGQEVTKAWIKFWDMLTLPEVEEKLKKLPGVVFCNAELPGGGLLSINHWYSTIHADKQLKDWVISSYMPREELIDRDKYLSDNYGVIKSNPGHSLVGQLNTNKGVVWCNGDLTNGKIPLVLSNLTINTIGLVSLYTSDGGMGIEGNEKFQEQLHIALKFGESLCALLTLSPGGVMVVKTYTLFSPVMASLTINLRRCFESFKIYKPVGSNPANKELYLVGIGFKGYDDAIVQWVIENYPSNPDLNRDLWWVDDLKQEELDWLKENIEAQVDSVIKSVEQDYLNPKTRKEFKYQFKKHDNKTPFEKIPKLPKDKMLKISKQ